MNLRRCIYLGLASSVVLLSLLLSAQTKAAERSKNVMSAEEMKQQRTQAAHRQRRIIFNNDGFDRRFAKAATPEG